ncbi:MULTISPECIES: hypothetical protein [Pseudoalteromonas]|uniref:Uncharacterized protein n=1 Tax=Pseudoalteromonas obscura TaxID=3048491 RepID=A0ABT7ERY4_9GAMM|nr:MULTISPECIES: hypothetical protein [Pseudoalteromonas]MBQ4839044.1 hypothetical protein [Pseudoalteromonas luteoviolacea]MDK2597782.1 hypothetical protein [Pseudoalteromonas sp. P94(2023)]
MKLTLKKHQLKALSKKASLPIDVTDQIGGGTDCPSFGGGGACRVNKIHGDDLCFSLGNGACPAH